MSHTLSAQISLRPLWVGCNLMPAVPRNCVGEATKQIPGREAPLTGCSPAEDALSPSPTPGHPFSATLLWFGDYFFFYHIINLETLGTHHITESHRSLEHTFWFYFIFVPERESHAAQTILKLNMSGRMALNSCLCFWVLGLEACPSRIHGNLYF